MDAADDDHADHDRDPDHGDHRGDDDRAELRCTKLL